MVKIEYIRDDIKYMELCNNDYITLKIFCCIKDLTYMSDSNYYVLGIRALSDYFKMSYRQIQEKIKWLIENNLIIEYPNQKGNYTYYRVNTDILRDYNDNKENIANELKNAKNEIKSLKKYITKLEQELKIQKIGSDSVSGEEQTSEWLKKFKKEQDKKEQQITIDEIINNK